MGIVLANPWGLAALVAVPLLVAVHCLRERSRRVRTSTLFLLDHAAPRPVAGRRFERFRGSLPFWLQLAALLVATWLLVEPRWIRHDPRETIVVLLDGSASMAAFLDDTKRALSAALRRIDASVGAAHWHLLDSAPGRGALHAGDRLDGLLEALDRWHPTAGTHDLRPAIGLALSLAPADHGGTILVTDHPVTVPPGVARFSVAAPIDNVGFTGADSIAGADTDAPDGGGPAADAAADGTDRAPRRWRALVTNHGTTPARRSLALLVGPAQGVPARAAGEPVALDLAPGESRALSGAWPASADRLLLTLTPDRFADDDVAPLARPEPRPVRVGVAGEGSGLGTIAAMLAAADGVIPDADPADADLLVGRFGTEDPRPAVLLPPADDSGAPLDPAPLAVADHPLVRDLAWGGLLSAAAAPIVPGDGDEVLVWKGRAPLVVLRTSILPGGTARETLLIGLDVDASSAVRLPALVVLLDRFVERVRGGIDRPWSDTFAAEQPIRLARATAIGTTPVVPGLSGVEGPFLGRAPRMSSFFEVRDDGGALLLGGACQQLDPREGDFSNAGPIDEVGAMRRRRALHRSVADPYLPGWIALVAAALLGAWGLQARAPSTTHPAPTGSP